MISTGIKYLDDVTGGLKLGDNVVWQVSDGVPVDHFIKSFFSGVKDFKGTIIFINFNFSPQTIYRRYSYIFKNKSTILIDAFTHGKGNSDPVFLEFYNDNTDINPETMLCIENPKNITSFVSLLNDIESKNKDGSFYIFDSLTGMNELWKDETAVLDFFTFTCPKLYELNTLAYWIYEKDAHSKEFMAGIMHITQIVFSISSSSSEHYELKINKLEDRTSLYGSEPNYFKIVNQDIHFQDKKTGELFRIGDKVKELRKEYKITQAELASSLNMTPGAVSQIENDIIAPSLQTLVQLSSVFNRPVDFFIGTTIGQDTKGFLVSNKNLKISSSHRNVEIFRMMESDDISITPYLVILKGEKEVNGPILLHKGREFLSVIEGELEMALNGETILLEKGNSIYITQSFIEKLQNKGKNDCKIIYILLN